MLLVTGYLGRRTIISVILLDISVGSINGENGLRLFIERVLQWFTSGNHGRSVLCVRILLATNVGANLKIFLADAFVTIKNLYLLSSDVTAGILRKILIIEI